MSPARKAAFTALETIEKRGAFADIVLSQLGTQTKISLRDRALANELVRGVLRWQKRLDWIIDTLYTGKPQTLALSVRLALRMALYQIMFLDRVPEFAAINESVELVKRANGQRWAGVTNGILRAFLRSGGEIEYPDKRRDPIKFLAVRYSHPEWMVARWLQRFDPESTRALCLANNRAAPISLRVNRLITTSSNIEEWLHSGGIDFSRSAYLENYFHVKGLINIENQEHFRQGKFTVQDESAGLVSLLLQPQAGDFVIDLCAAPGGKSTHAAELMLDRGIIVANDRNFSRLRLVQAAAQRLKLQSIEPVNADGSRLATTPAQRVLVDAPCSGLGVLSKKPDLRWKRRAEDIQGLVHIQQALLNNAANLVTKGGILVYSTCTIEPEENEQAVNCFLEHHTNFVLENAQDFVPSELVDKHGFVRTYPHMHDMDGSFAARMRKVG